MSPSFINIHTHQIHQNGTVEVFNVNEPALPVPEQAPYFTAGIHPWFIKNLAEQQEQLSQLVLQEKCIAIGECGLDKLCDTDFLVQKTAFRWQIEQATTIQKPLIIHCVKAFDEVLAMLHEKQTTPPVVFHGFNKSKELGLQITKQGHYLSFGRHLFKNEKLQQLLQEIQHQHWFLETDDASFGIRELYQFAAQILETDVETVILQVHNSFKTIFKV